MKCFIAFTLLILAGCSPKSHDKDTLRIHLSAEPATLNPSGFEDGHALKVLSNLLDPLFENDSKGNLKLLSAQDYKISPDGKKITVRLKENLKWSDGSSVTSQDFAYGIHRAIDPKRTGKQAHLFRSLQSISTPDPRTVIFHLKESSPYFLKALSLPVSPLPRHWFLDSQGQERTWSPEMPTNGPYFLSKYQSTQWIDLSQNPHYALSDRKPKTPKVRWIIIQDEQTASQLFRSGEVDILTRVPGFEVKQFDQEKLLDKSPFAATFYIGFNVKKAPGSDIRFRKALASAIDPNAVVSLIEGFDQPTGTWIPQGFEGGDFKPKALQANVKASSFPSAELSFDSSHKNQTIAEYIQSQAKVKAQISLTLSPSDWKTHLSKLSRGITPVFRFAWQAPFMDPIPHLEIFTTHNPNNKTNWSSPQYDALIKKISTTPSGPKRVALIHDAQRLLLDEERVIIPLYHYTQLHAIASRVKHFSVNPFSVIAVHDIELH